MLGLPLQLAALVVSIGVMQLPQCMIIALHALQQPYLPEARQQGELIVVCTYIHTIMLGSVICVT
jgi:hypothetical protein